MKFLPLLFLLVLVASPAKASCPPDPQRPQLTFWLCEIETELNRRDRGENYQRRLTLVSDASEVRAIRNFVKTLDDETCRRFEEHDQALLRILHHQGLPNDFAASSRRRAAAEFRHESTQSPLVSCEVQLLKESATETRYLQYYYLESGYGSGRERLIIQVETKW